MLYRLLAGSCAAAGVVLGAVAVPDKTCRTLSENVLFKGGSAVDAAIVASLCSGVINAYASGIGGGAFMLVQPSFESANFSSNMVDEDGRQIDPLDPVMIDCRETAPSNLDKELISRTGFKRKSLEIGVRAMTLGNCRSIKFWIIHL